MSIKSWSQRALPNYVVPFCPYILKRKHCATALILQSGCCHYHSQLSFRLVLQPTEFRNVKGEGKFVLVLN